MKNGKNPSSNLFVNPLWLTPVWEIQTDFDNEFNENLLTEIYQIGKEISTGKSVAYDSLWSYDKPHLNKLKEYILHTVTESVRQDIPEARELNVSCEPFMCWANIREPGESLEIHAHTDAAIAATYFIKCKDECGDLILFDTKDAIEWETGELLDGLKKKRIKAVEGKLAFFPSYVLHYVEQNNSDDLRVSLTCDLKKVLDKSAPNTIVLSSWVSRMLKIKEWNNVL